MKKRMGWDGRTWIYVRLGREVNSWRLAGEQAPNGRVEWVGGAAAIGRLYELASDGGFLDGLPPPRGDLSLVFAVVTRGEMRLLGWERVARLGSRAAAGRRFAETRGEASRR